jgi:hypothetical protein
MLVLKAGAVVPRRPADQADRRPTIPAVAHNCVMGASRSLKAGTATAARIRQALRCV